MRNEPKKEPRVRDFAERLERVRFWRGVRGVAIMVAALVAIGCFVHVSHLDVFLDWLNGGR
jgi:hypothetical protein